MDESSDDVDSQKVHRSRFSGGAEMLAQCTTELARKHGRSFVRYDEAQLLSNAEPDRASLAKFAPILKRFS